MYLVQGLEHVYLRKVLASVRAWDVNEDPGGAARQEGPIKSRLLLLTGFFAEILPRNHGTTLRPNNVDLEIPFGRIGHRNQRKKHDASQP